MTRRRAADHPRLGLAPLAPARFAAGAVGALAHAALRLSAGAGPVPVRAVWLIDGAAGGPSRAGLACIGGLRSAGGGASAISSPGLWWLGAAFLVEADQFAWALPFGVLGLPAVLALFSGLRLRARAPLWTPASAASSRSPRPDRQRMAARPSLHRLSLEPPRHGARPEPLADAERLARRPLRPDASRRPRSAPRRRLLGPGRRGAAALAWRPRWRCCARRRHGRLRRSGVSRREPTADGRRRALAHHAAEPAAGRQVQPAEPRRDHAPLPRAQRQRRARRPRLADVTHLDLAGIGLPVPAPRDPAALAQIAALLPPGVDADHRRGARDEPLPGETVGASSTRSRSSTTTARSSAPTTRCISCRSANTCRIPRRRDPGVGLRQFVHIPGGFEPARRRGSLDVPGLPPVAARSATRRSSPARSLPEGPRPA